MNAAQKEIVDKHRSKIIDILSTYSDAAIMWLRNERYLTRQAEDLVLSERINLAKAMRILDLLTVADNGWLGLTGCLENFSNKELARILDSELKKDVTCASDDRAEKTSSSTPKTQHEKMSNTELITMLKKRRMVLLEKLDVVHIARLMGSLDNVFRQQIVSITTPLAVGEKRERFLEYLQENEDAMRDFFDVLLVKQNTLYAAIFE